MRERLEPLALRALEFEEVLRERMSELIEQHTQARHLRLDAVVKEEYLVRLRGDLLAAEADHAAGSARLLSVEAEGKAYRAAAARLRGRLDPFLDRLNERSSTLLRTAPRARRLVRGALKRAVRARARLRRQQH